MASPQLTQQIFESLTESRAFIMTIGKRRAIAEDTRGKLMDIGIPATITDSIDGSISGLETKWTYEIDRPGAGYRIGYKVVAVCVGHYMLWYAAHLMRRVPVTIFEDDVRMSRDWKERLTSACEFLPDDWDMLFLGSCDVIKGDKLSNELYRAKAALCSHAYIVSDKGLSLLLNHCHQIWAPIDIAISIRAIPYMKAYVMIPRIAEQNKTVLNP